MSKFCGVISKQLPNPESEFQLDFVQLEALADWLINETNYMSEDHQTKCGFMQDQHIKIVYNDQNFIDMDNKLKSLHFAMMQLETEIQENGLNMLQLEKTVKILERLQFCDTCPTTSCCNPHAALLELLKTTGRDMMGLATQIEEISESTPLIQPPINPYEIISAILDCHTTTLTLVEKKIDQVLDGTAAVDEAYSTLLSIEKKKTNIKLFYILFCSILITVSHYRRLETMCTEQLQNYKRALLGTIKLKQE